MANEKELHNTLNAPSEAAVKAALAPGAGRNLPAASDRNGELVVKDSDSSSLQVILSGIGVGTSLSSRSLISLQESVAHRAFSIRLLAIN